MLISSILFIRYYYYFASHQPEVSYFSKIRIFDCLKIIIIFIHTADDDNFLFIIKINICCCYFCVIIIISDIFLILLPRSFPRLVTMTSSLCLFLCLVVVVYKSNTSWLSCNCTKSSTHINFHKFKLLKQKLINHKVPMVARKVSLFICKLFQNIKFTLLRHCSTLLFIIFCCFF